MAPHTLSAFALAALVFTPGLAQSLEGYGTVNGGTTGGAGGTTTTVSAVAAFQTAVKGDSPKVVYVKGPLTPSSRTDVGSNTSIIGVGSTAVINGRGLRISGRENVIVRNLVINKVVGDDAIGIQDSTNIWIDHNELYSDVDHGYDYYDGLLDITHGSDYVTVSYNYFHDHWKCSLIGGDPGNSKEDKGHFHVTYHHNLFRNIHTRTPALRFGQVHSYNNYFENIVDQGIHTRSGGQALIEGNVFASSKEPISTYGFVILADSPVDPNGDYEPDGYANLGASNTFGSGANNITKTGNFTTVPYKYTLTPLASVQSTVQASAGVGHLP